MQAVILAAGLGKRLKSLTENYPKCMIKINGSTIIERCLNIITKYPINKIIIVTGHKGEVLKKEIKYEYNNIRIEYIENPVYEKTNNIYSLLCCKNKFIEDDTILIESDLVFSQNVFNKLWNSKYENVALVDKYESWMDGTVVKINSHNNIIDFISKHEFNYDEIKDYYKTINIYKFSKKFINCYFSPLLETYCDIFGNNEYYELVLKLITNTNNKHLHTCKINHNDLWYEIDDEYDLKIAKTIFKSSLSEYLKTEHNIWKFPRLIDFQSNINSYFPTDKIIGQINYYFKTLFRSNHSNIIELKQIISDLENCYQDDIIITNKELINSYFNNNNFTIGYIGNDLSNMTENFKRDIIWINDPSSIDKCSHVFIDYLEHNNKILDQYINIFSIPSFSSKTLIINDINNTLVNYDKILKQTNIVIHKNYEFIYGLSFNPINIFITKNSYLKLNFNKEICNNLSSFLEFTLLTIKKNIQEYTKSIKILIEERNNLLDTLGKIKYINIIDYSYNFILCEINDKEKYNIEDKLFNKNILIKKISLKRFRITVNNKYNLLTDTLKAIE